MKKHFDKYDKYGAYHWDAIEGTFKNRITSNKYSIPLLLRYNKVLSCIEGTNKNVIDVGCGDGALTHLIAQRNHRVIGFDLEILAITLAKAKMKSISYKYTPELYSEDFLSYDFEKGAYDYIVLADVIEHLHEPNIIIQRGFDLLKKGGYILLTTPVRIEGSIWDAHHVKEYTAEELREYLSLFSRDVVVELFMPLISYRLFKRYRTVFNIIDYLTNPLKISKPFSDFCMIFATMRK